MKELEELPPWWGEEISSSSPSPSSSPLEDRAWKSNMQMFSPSTNMENEYARWKFDFRREEQFWYASQATLQMSFDRPQTEWYLVIEINWLISQVIN